jgi:hypothetical protein
MTVPNGAAIFHSWHDTGTTPIREVTSHEYEYSAPAGGGRTLAERGLAPVFQEGLDLPHTAMRYSAVFECT